MIREITSDRGSQCDYAIQLRDKCTQQLFLNF